MSSSDWYTERTSDDIQQGDILPDFPVVLATLDEDLIQDALHGLRIEPPAETLLVDVIVLSQSCDIANEKVTSIVLAPLMDFSLWLSQVAPKSSQRKSLEASIRKGQVNYTYVLPGESIYNLPERVVDFRVLYTSSIEAIRRYIRVVSPRPRYALTDRPTDALSQRFGLFFSRVAEPDRPD